MNEEEGERNREEKQYKKQQKQKKKRDSLMKKKKKKDGRTTLSNEKHRDSEEENSSPSSSSKVKKNDLRSRLRRVIKEDCSVNCVLKYLGILLFCCGFVLPFGLWSVRRITYRETTLLVTNGPVPISVSCATVFFKSFLITIIITISLLVVILGPVCFIHSNS